MSTALRSGATRWLLAALCAVWTPVASPAAKEGLGGDFRYDVERLRRTDPKWVCGGETDPMTADVGRLRGVAVGPDDEIVVAGETAWAVLGKDGKTVSRSLLESPAQCVAVGPDGEIYLGVGDHVEVVDAARTGHAVWGVGAGALITAIAATDDDVFVVDAAGKQVLRFSKSGEPRGHLAVKDEARGIPGLVIPSPYCDLAVGADDSLWVVNPGRHALENYRANGDLIGSWSQSADGIEGFCGCCNPTHVAITPNGRFVTSEKGLARVKLYSPVGDFVGVVAGPEQFDEGTVGLDLAVDSSGRILVLDPKRGAVRVFVEKRNP
jgi:hypothetical protein